MAKERRCNLFDDEGKPRRLRDGTKGCPRDASACHFAHPHERDWEAAHSSYPPRPELVVDSDSDFYYMLIHSDRAKDYRGREKDRERVRERERAKEREREKKRSLSFLGSPPHRRDSTTTRGSPGPPSRRSTLDTAMEVSVPAKRGRSPALSSSSDQLEKLRKDSHYRTNEIAPSRWDQPPPTSRLSRSPSRDRDKEQVSLTKKTPTARSHVPDAPTTQQPPREPSMPPPVQPAPPPPQLPEVPKLPSFASTQKTASGGPKEVSMEEQRVAWHDRIDLMFTSIASRRDYTKLESELSQIRSLSNTSIVNNMPDADRAHINAQKMALELQMEVKRKEVNDTIQKLIGSNFWPVLRTPQIAEMEKTLDDAKKHVVEVRGLLDDVRSSCAALFKTSAPDWTQDSDRPVKRRRLEGDADTPGLNAEPATEDAALEFEAFRDKLTELDRHLVDLENDITQRDTIISDEIELQIDTRLEEENALYPPVKEPGEVSPTEIEAVVNSKNKELVHAVTVTGEEIGELAMEVAELITKVSALEARCKTLEAQNQEFKSKLAQDTMRHAQSQGALVRRDKEIEAIAAALQAYITQAPAGQTAGDLPSADYIMESLGSQLDGLLREKFCTTMVNIQQEVFDKVQESHSRTLDTVSPKIVLLLKMVNLITARLGKPDADGVNVG